MSKNFNFGALEFSCFCEKMEEDAQSFCHINQPELEHTKRRQAIQNGARMSTLQMCSAYDRGLQLSSMG
jgi:hypothetical protein